jgi:hypothetical protein
MTLKINPKIRSAILVGLVLTIAFVAGRVIGEVYTKKRIYVSQNPTPLIRNNDFMEALNTMGNFISLPVQYYKMNHSFVPLHGTLASALQSAYYADSYMPPLKIVPTLSGLKELNFNTVAVQYDKNNGYIKGPPPVATVAEAVEYNPKSTYCLMIAMVKTNSPVKTSFKDALYFSSGFGNNKTGGSTTATSGIWYGAKKLPNGFSCNFNVINVHFDFGGWPPGV